MQYERQEHVKEQRSFSILHGVGGLVFAVSAAVLGTVHADDDDRSKEFVPPTVFQAAGPTIASIQSTVDQYRAALGAVNNGNAPGPLASGRREINWDGGGSATTLDPTPMTRFLDIRGANFTTRGTGFVQAPREGIAATFGNPSYATIFQAFSPQRLFSAIGSNRTTVEFFVPGSNGSVRATTTGFGAVFSDVDRPNGGERGAPHQGSTLIDYFDGDGDLLFHSFVPASPGDASVSFLGILFADTRIARVRITAGNKAPGPDDLAHRDIVMMDDFLYGEPQANQ
jgi:hypothetical protein